MLGTGLNRKERLFWCYCLSAEGNVQAAIGQVPLSMGPAGGQLVLSVAVLAILITAPLAPLASTVPRRTPLVQESPILQNEDKLGAFVITAVIFLGGKFAKCIFFAKDAISR